MTATRLHRPPTSASDAYSRLVAVSSPAGYRLDLAALAASVASSCATYVELAQQQALFRYTPDDAYAPMSPNLKKLYDLTYRRSGPGRELRDEIMSMALPNFNLCPYCGVGPVSQLDHYLPRSAFPELSVSPDNLVPSCMNCNYAKRDHVPNGEGDQVFHPYFDDFNEPWLEATLVDGDPYRSVDFLVSAPPTWPAARVDRARFTFERLGLRTALRALATQEMLLSVSSLTLWHARGGANSVMYELDLRAAEASANVNSWKHALYCALRDDEAFCDRGWERFLP